MTGLEWAGLLAAAFAGGAVNSVAGGGTFLTFPMLILTGMPSVAANATNTMALWPGSIASMAAYRHELRAHVTHLKRYAVLSFLGGLVGSLLLLYTPETIFSALVPWLLLGATVIFAGGPRVTAWLRLHADTPHAHGPARQIFLGVLQFSIAVYGGYFGAGIGILMLAMLQLYGLQNLHEMNGIKTFLATIINGITVSIFALAGIIVWPVALAMMAAAILGGYCGATYARRMNPVFLRRGIIAIGVVLSVYFWVG